MRHDLTKLISQQLKDQFEFVVKEEIRRHNEAVEKSNREIAELKDLFLSFKKSDEKFKMDCLNELQAVRDRYSNEIRAMEDAFNRQSKQLKLKEKEINDVILGFYSKIETLVSEHDKKLLVFEFEKKISDTQTLMYSLQKVLQEDIKATLDIALRKNEEMKAKVEALEDECRKRFYAGESLLNAHVVDAKGVLRELNVYKKTVFIMEKNIEYLYDRIKRIMGGK